MGFVAIALEGRHLGVVRTPTGGAQLVAETGAPGDDAVFERIDLAHGRVALRTPDGLYVATHACHPGSGDGGPNQVGPHLSPELTQCAAFEELLHPGGLVSLRGCGLHYLGVQASGKVVADRIVNGSWERFTYLSVPQPLTYVPVQPPSPTWAARVAVA